MGPTLIVIGGPNGAGKSTFVRTFLQEEAMPYVCADEFAKQLNPESPETVAVEAGRQFLVNIQQRIAGKQSMIVESTLSGRTFQKKLQQCRNLGFRVKILFIFLGSAELCTVRVAARVRKGGHHVPTADIVRRYVRSLQNFWNLYRPLAHGWQLFYNSSATFEVVAEGQNETCRIHDVALFEQFHALMEGTTDE